jgi:hypothetical protein
MKNKLLQFLCLSVITLHATAQKGSLLIEGDINYNTTKDKVYSPAQTSKSSSVAYNQLLGYQPLNHWVIGGMLSVTHVKNADGTNVSTINGLFAGPFIRYTYPLGGIFFISGQFQASFGNNKSHFTNGSFSSESKNVIHSYDLVPILSMNMKNNFGLNFSIGGAEYSISKQDKYNKIQSFTVNFGKMISVGITKKFSPKVEEE